MHDCTLPIGPQHPSIKEPTCLRLKLRGNYIQNARIRMGYTHRGIEKLLEGKTVVQGLYVVQRICGICLPGKEELILSNGDIVTLKDFARQYLPKKSLALAENADADSKGISWKDNKTDIGKIVAVQRIQAPPILIRVRTKSGAVLHFTSPHKIMIDSPEGQKFIPCGDLKAGHLLYAPRKIDIERPTNHYELDFVSDHFKVGLSPDMRNKIKSLLRKRFGSLKEASDNLKIRYDVLSSLRIQKLSLAELKRICSLLGLPYPRTRKHIKAVSYFGTGIKIQHKTISKDFMYLLGLLASDGHFPVWRAGKKARDYRVAFVNKNESLIKTFIRIHRKVFPGWHIEKAKRLKEGALCVRASNLLLSNAALKLGITGERPDIKPIFKLPEKLISGFLRGYFDGDGTCAFREGKPRSHGCYIAYSTKPRLNAKRLKQLLQRMGIASSMTTHRYKGFKGGTEYVIKTTNKLDTLNFIEKIGSSHPEKRKQMSEIKKFYTKHETFSSYFMRVPEICSVLFKKLRKRYKVPVDVFGTIPTNIYGLERGRAALKPTFSKYVRILERHTDKSDKDLLALKMNLSNSFYLDPVKEVKKVRFYGRHVYDITVKNHHNFIPGGAFVVSNCPAAHASAYIRAAESAMGLKPPKIVRYLRTMEAELERINSHMLWAGFMAHEIGYEALFMFFWREREKLLDVLEKVTGGRIHHNYHSIGSVRFGLGKGDDRFILDRLDSVEKKMKNYLGTYRSDSIIKARLKDVGILTKGDVNDMCLVGPTARGSGINNDVRMFDPYLAYPDVDFEIPLEYGGDAWSRALVRLREILESIKIVRQLVKGMPKGDVPAPVPFGKISAESIGRSEAPRGENYHFLLIKDGTIERAKIRPPTLANIISLEQMLCGREIADTPVILASLDPCFACMERVLIAREDRTESVTEEEFRKRYTKTLTESGFRRKYCA